MHSAFGALVSIWGSMTVCICYNEEVCHTDVFSHFWTTVEQ